MTVSNLETNSVLLQKDGVGGKSPKIKGKSFPCHEDLLAKIVAERKCSPPPTFNSPLTILKSYGQTWQKDYMERSLHSKHGEPS